MIPEKVTVHGFRVHHGTTRSFTENGETVVALVNNEATKRKKTLNLKMIPDTELELVFILFFLELGKITAV